MKKWQTCVLGAGSLLCLTACSGKSVTSEHQTKDEMKTEQTASKIDGSRWQDLPFI